MGKLLEVAKKQEVEAGKAKVVTVDGKEILLLRVGDNYYATSNRCPHMGGKLSEGKFEGTVVTCPRHGSRFDIADGRVVRWLKGTGLISSLGKALKPPRPLTTYRLEIRGDDLLVEL